MGRCDLRNRLRGTIWYHLESSLPRADLEVGALGEANIPITNSPPLWLTAWSHGPAENGQIVRESGLSKVQPNRFMADQTPRRTLMGDFLSLSATPCLLVNCAPPGQRTI